MVEQVGALVDHLAVLAAKGDEHGQVVYESADLLYHLAVLWRAAGVSLDEVAAELASRRRP